MTLITLLDRLAKKYPKFLSDDRDELKDIRTALSLYPEEDLDSIWNEFADTWTAGWGPKRAVFVKIAEGLRIGKKSGVEYEYICYPCFVNSLPYRYALDTAGKCPVCGNHERPLYALGRKGVWIDRQKAEDVVSTYTKGTTQKYSRTKDSLGNYILPRDK